MGITEFFVDTAQLKRPKVCFDWQKIDILNEIPGELDGEMISKPVFFWSSDFSRSHLCVSELLRMGPVGPSQLEMFLGAVERPPLKRDLSIGYHWLCHLYRY